MIILSTTWAPIGFTHVVADYVVRPGVATCMDDTLFVCLVVKVAALAEEC